MVNSYTRQNFTTGEIPTAVKMNQVSENIAYNKEAYGTGWIEDTETWTYASATTITVPSGALLKYQKGDKFKLTANSVELYGYIVDVADTLLTVTGDALTNHTFTDNYYSKIENPFGFPESFALSAFQNLSIYQGGLAVISGWGFKQSTGGAGTLATTVTYGITFSEIPVVVVGTAGLRAGSDPSNLGELNSAFGSPTGGYGFSATGFTAYTADPANASLRCGFTWIATGAL